MPGTLHTSTIVPVTYQTSNVQFLPDHSKVFAASYSGFSIVDFPVVVTTHTFNAPGVSTHSGEGVGWTGTDILAEWQGANRVYRWTYAGVGTFEADVYAGDVRGVNTMFDSNGAVHWWNDKLYAYYQFSLDGTIIDSNAKTGAYFYPVQVFGSQDGKLWVFGQRSDRTTAVFYNHTDNTYFLVSGLPAGDAGGALHYVDGDHDQFVFGWAGHLYAVNTTSHAIVASNTSIILPYAIGRVVFKNVAYGAADMWVGFEQISLADLSQLQALDSNDWGYSPGITLYDPVENALVLGIGSSFNLIWLFLGAINAPVKPAAQYCIPVCIGRTFTSRGQILRPAAPQESGTQTGPSQGKKRRMTYAAPLLADAQGISMGVDFLLMRPLDFKSPGGTVSLTLQETFSGVYWGTVDATFNYDNMWCWEITRPYPATVVSVECQLETNENL